MNYLLVFLMITGLAHAEVPLRCGTPITLEEFNQTLQQVRDRYFMDLAAIKLSVVSFSSSAYFLQAQPSFGTMLREAHRRSYRLELNPRLLDCPPPEIGLESILVHELEHVRDYVSWTSPRLMGRGLRYVLSGHYRDRYERATDQKVLELGLGEGLAQYREWIYQWLGPKDLARKRRRYMTPEEIRGETSSKTSFAAL